MKVRYSFKLTALILTMTMLSGITASCGSDSGNNELPADTADSGTTAEAPEPDPIEELGTHNFGGKEYVIYSPNSGYGTQPHYDFEFVVDEANGEVINDAVYNRVIKVEELYNVDIVNITDQGGTVSQNVKKSVLAGEDAYSLVSDAIYDMRSPAINGIYANYYDFDAIDLTQPWWNQSATDTLSINGKCYLQYNYINSASALATHCLFYNKNIADEKKVDSIYDMVIDGTWTIDRMLKITADVSADLNGDTVYDSNDFFGFIASYGCVGIMHYGLDNPFLSISEDGVVSSALMTERMQTTVEKVYKLCFEDNRSWIRPIAEDSKLATMFSNGQSLFYAGYFFDMITTFRDMKDDFGLLPYPKFDEEQDGYYTAIHGAVPMIAIPGSVVDYEMVGVVTEALAIESYKNVRPAMIDLTLKNKLLRDEQSVQIYDMFLDGIRADIAMVYGETDKVYNVLMNLLSEKSTDLASYVSTYIPSAIKSYQATIDAFMED